ncbi:MAG: aminoglycoside phosphotransferase family protein [Eubacteriales bacterium]|jgi:aminoglycoside phosphotransferase (APT) family kinase protein|nr:aminoglycoside phosphotransferase family protein [Eubacteriales bacterium]
MDANAQTAAGLMAGEVLRKIHSLSVPIHGDWRERYFNVIGKRIDAYHTKGMPFEGSDIILAYLEQNSNLTAGRPQRLLHGDFHEGNLMFSDNGELYVIDLFDEGFGFCGDPWYDFRLLIRTAGTRFI